MKRIDKTYLDPRWEGWDANEPQPDRERPPHWYDERDMQAKEAEKAEDLEEARLYGDAAAIEVAGEYEGSRADEVRSIWRRFSDAGYKHPESNPSAGTGTSSSADYLSPYDRLQATKKIRGEYVDPKSVTREIQRRIKLKAVYAEIGELAKVADDEVHIDVLEKAPLTVRAAQKLKIGKFLGGRLVGKPPVTVSEYMYGENNPAVDQTKLTVRQRTGGWLLPRRILTGTTPEGLPIYEQDNSIPSVDKAINLVIDNTGRSWHQGRIGDMTYDAMFTVGVRDDWQKGDRIIDHYSLKQLRQLKHAVRALKENPLRPFHSADQGGEDGNGPNDTPTDPNGTPTQPIPPSPTPNPNSGSTAASLSPTPAPQPPSSGSTASSSVPPRPRTHRRATRPQGSPGDSAT
ncbi:MAG TPA: hypothetical protein VK978_04620 [Candidatus Saccharimonadales bacterium]|nr:hypothetical protein [Candidatus Saccharimonadales bacterium]